MEITPRQYGRLEMAAWALAKHSEHNEVCMVLSRGIMQVLDEIADGDDLDELRREIPDWHDDAGRLPDVPDWRDGAARQDADDKLTRIRLIVSENAGASLAYVVKAILDSGVKPAELAGLLHVHPSRISEAKHGHSRSGFKQIFTEVLGYDGGAAAEEE